MLASGGIRGYAFPRSPVVVASSGVRGYAYAFVPIHAYAYVPTPMPSPCLVAVVFVAMPFRACQWRRFCLCLYVEELFHPD